MLVAKLAFLKDMYDLMQFQTIELKHRKSKPWETKLLNTWDVLSTDLAMGMLGERLSECVCSIFFSHEYEFRVQRTQWKQWKNKRKGARTVALASRQIPRLA